MGTVLIVVEINNFYKMEFVINVVKIV